ncbi:CAMK family protein kinase [Tritrichomonas foetus]|uniref:CAMK family protein kinase n=1 Tax=Tritrichomonas foetus TaxID=1144522 RepID=A0A1J4KRY0_9EUKA|nr:CAMK family protein kinase [Tritrichomonas foetus]|eukprot:OHT14031.1 CAMK family protein kinase [Tritrichomonas foetus]
MRRAKNQIRDLEAELSNISPRKRASTSLSKHEKANDELSKMSTKIIETNIILNSYETLVEKYFPASPKKVDSFVTPKKGCEKTLSELKQIVSRPISRNQKSNRVMSRLTTPRIESGLKMKPNDKSPLPPISITKLDKTKHDRNDLKFLKKMNKSSVAVFEIIKRFFNSTNPQVIKSEYDNLKEKKKVYIEKQSEIETSLNKLQNKKTRLENSILKYKPTKIRDAKLITEGKAALTILIHEKTSSSNQLLDIQSQKRAFMISAIRISSFFNIPEPKDFSEVIDTFAFVKQVFMNPSIKTLLKLSHRGIRSKVSFSIPETPSLKTMIDARDSIHVSSSSKVDVPSLKLDAIKGTNEFYPGTRSTRRAFSAFNSYSDVADGISGSVNHDLQFIGKSLGNIFVDRYSVGLIENRQTLQRIICHVDPVALSPIFMDKVNSYSPKEVIKCFVDQYVKCQDFLYLLVLTDFEISKIEKCFMSFLSTREYILTKINENYENGNYEEFIMGMFDSLLNSNEIAACWFIHDIVLATPASGNIPDYFAKMVPYFHKKLLSVSSIVETSKATPYIAYLACFYAFLNLNSTPSFHELVLDLIDNDMAKIMCVFASSMSHSISRCGFISIFQIGSFCPQYFYTCIEFQNQANSDFLVYIKQNLQYPTCIKAATGFFNEAFHKITSEAVLFTTAMIYHYVIQQLSLNPINVDVVTHLLSSLITVVANRNAYTSDQLSRLNFLPFLMKNFELEAFLANQTNQLNHPLSTSQSIMNKIEQQKLQQQNQQLPPKPQKPVSIPIPPLISKVQNHANNNTINDDGSNSNHNNSSNGSISERPKSELPILAGSRVSYLDIPKKKLPKLNLENPKLQLHFKPKPTYNLRSSISISDREYLTQRVKYPIYLSPSLHIVYVQLMFALLIDHNLHRLDIFFCDPFPVVNRKPNILYVVMEHMEGQFNNEIIDDLTSTFTPETVNSSSHSSLNQLSDNSNSSLKSYLNSFNNDIPHMPNLNGQRNANKNDEDKPITQLKEVKRHLSLERNLVLAQFKSVPNFIAAPSKIQDDEDEEDEQNSNSLKKKIDMPQYMDYIRLLRLTVPSKFNPSTYSNGQHIASGAFGAVMGVNVEGKDLAVKILEKSRTEFDNPRLIEVFTEVTILEMCKGDRRVTQLHDYGCTADSYYIVMEFYPTTLKSWRKSFLGNPGEEDSKPKPAPIETCLRIFKEFLNCATILTDHKINHFDIKCDNVMLDCDGMPALGDFGESMLYNSEKNCYTLLNRGTEWIKSPEMLSIALDSSASNPKYDRLKKIGAGPASDVWSIGCLFFELITGEYLFIDSDWSRFFMRITNNDEPILTEEKIKMLPDDPRYKNFIEFVLQRNVRRRPNIRQLIVKFDEMFPDASKAPLPVIPKINLSPNL